SESVALKSTSICRMRCCSQSMCLRPLIPQCAGLQMRLFLICARPASWSQKQRTRRRSFSSRLASRCTEGLVAPLAEAVLYVVAKYNIQHATFLVLGSACPDGVGRHVLLPSHLKPFLHHVIGGSSACRGCRTNRLPGRYVRHDSPL